MDMPVKAEVWIGPDGSVRIDLSHDAVKHVDCEGWCNGRSASLTIRPYGGRRLLLMRTVFKIEEILNVLVPALLAEPGYESEEAPSVTSVEVMWHPESDGSEIMDGLAHRSRTQEFTWKVDGGGVMNPEQQEEFARKAGMSACVTGPSLGDDG